ncbi:hypothetical protein NC651_024376 [Populus alba x Populus x berolinensis]|nr:hypothetical protein NC651_024376 [Populus alba x Populus x berolinensis]
MASLHSWLGLITICLFGLQCSDHWLTHNPVLGFFSFVFPGAETSARGTSRPWRRFLVVRPCFSSLQPTSTAQTGLPEKVFVNSTGLLPVLFAVSVGLSGVSLHEDIINNIK